MVHSFLLRSSFLTLLLSASIFADGVRYSCVSVVHERRTAFDGTRYSSWYKLLSYAREALKQACYGNFAIFHISFTSNFHVLKEGVVYRSAQPIGSDLERYAKEYNIKTIINLRNEVQTKKKYQDLWKALCTKVQQLALDGVSISMINIPLDNDAIIHPTMLEKALSVLTILR